ncbi:hypothetical protein GCM10025773_28860 [Microbacterium jejuense]
MLVPMRYLMTTNGGGPAPDEALFAEMGALIREMASAGVLLATGGLGQGFHVASQGGELSVTDGPYAEAKETIVSFALIEARSDEEALQLARRFWSVVGDGEGDVRPVFGSPE